jgi:hypothetical protein
MDSLWILPIVTYPRFLLLLHGRMSNGTKYSLFCEDVVELSVNQNGIHDRKDKAFVFLLPIFLP